MNESTRLVQLYHPTYGRKIALVREPMLVLLDGFDSAYNLALKAIRLKTDLRIVIEQHLSPTELFYDAIYDGTSEWKLLPSFDHPGNPFACLVSGTGLTHKNSALNRQMMHQQENTITDSMKMYQWGVQGGRPQQGQIGTQPEWFYKGTGNILKGHRDVLSVPSYADDGGEEPEIAGIYVVDESGQPFRVGFTTANEFSDHVMEKKNYLYLAPSKLRECAVGPELVIDGDFTNIQGKVKVLRSGAELWSTNIKTGEENMAHTLGNLEYHHFKYADHRQPLQAHVHFFGADAFSFGAEMKLQSGDEMQVLWNGFGRPLRNTLHVTSEQEEIIVVEQLCSSSTHRLINQ